MAPRQISDAEWDQHKSSITSLYLSGSLEGLKNSMLENHEFDATEAQYIRRLKIWRVKKNSNKAKWTFVARQLEKRKLEGKDSETYINGQLVSYKKVKRETSRYNLPSLRKSQHYVEILRSLAIKATSPQFQSSVKGSYLGGVNHDLQGSWISGQTSFSSNGDKQQIKNTFNFSQSCQPSTCIDPSMLIDLEVQESALQKKFSREARSLLSECLEKPVDPDCPDYVSLVSSRLESIIIESRDGELVQNLQLLYGPSYLDAQFQLLRYMVYLSSNSLISQFVVDKFLSWTIENKATQALERLIGLSTVTVEIFASILLLSAIRIENVDIVRFFLEKGIDPNSVGLDYFRRSALGEAIERGNCQLVQMLLDAGANPNAPAIQSRIMPLTIAVGLTAATKLDLVQLLLDAGADFNIIPGRAGQYTLLYYVAKLGDINLVRLLLNAGAYVNISGNGLEGALQVAAKSNHTEIVKILLEAGADVDAPSSRFNTNTVKVLSEDEDILKCVTAIQHASRNDNVEMVQILLEYGANAGGLLFVDCHEVFICEENPFQTPLQSAAINGNIILARMLLREHVGIDARSYGDTPLQIAARNSNIKLVKYLLERGANANAPPCVYFGRSAVQGAAETGNCELIQVLVDAGADINCAAVDDNGRTALQAAAFEGHAEAVRKLIALGADVNAEACSEYGVTGLQAAAGEGHVDIVELLLQAGADVNAPAGRFYGGRTAIQAAAELGDINIVKLLLRAGANVNLPSSENDGVSALHDAVSNNDLALVQILLANNADVNEIFQGKTTFQLAAQNGNAQMVEYLILAAGNINAPNADVYGGWTLLRSALKSENTELVISLIARYTSTDRFSTHNHWGTILGDAALNRFIGVEVFEILISYGADINQSSDSWYGTPLQAAIYRFRCDIVETLLNAGANVNAIGQSNQETPLQMAIAYGNIDLAHKLISLGADVNAPADQRYGKTALQKAVAIENVQLVRYLLQLGADVNAPAVECGGATALQTGVIKGNLPIVRILLEAGADINAPAAKENGRTALEAAAEHGRLEILHLLFKYDGEQATLESRCKEAAELAEKENRFIIARILREYKTT